MFNLYTAMLIINLFNYNQAENILIAISMKIRNTQLIVEPLVAELLQRGHTITAVSTHNFPKHQNLSQIITKDTYNYEAHDYTVNNWRFKAKKIFDCGFHSSRDMLTNIEFQALLNSDVQFDLVIIADLPLCFLSAAVLHRFKTYSVSIINHNSASHVHWLLGESFNPAYQPEVKVGLGEQMTLIERIYNVYIMLITLFDVYTWYIPLSESTLDSLTDALPFLKDRPPLTEVIANKSLVLLPTHAAIDYNYPLTPRVRSIAGVTIKKSKALSKEFEEFMANSKGGVILMCWGSLIRGSLIKNSESILLSAFAKIKQNVIWKYSNLTTAMPIPPNVMVVDWLPQLDILAHKNLRLFMSHGGINSITEATHYGVPLIITPFFLDQHRNAKKIENSGVGVILQATNMTTESVLWAIQEVAGNPRYKETAMKRSRMFKDRVLSPVDEAVYWIEYVLKHGDVLKPATATMPWYKIFLVDIIVITLLVITLFLYVIWFIFKFLCNVVYLLFIKFKLNKKNKIN